MNSLADEISDTSESTAPHNQVGIDKNLIYDNICKRLKTLLEIKNFKRG